MRRFILQEPRVIGAIVAIAAWSHSYLGIECVIIDDACDYLSLGDGYCDRSYNVPSCGYDGGDCCTCTCPSDAVYSCTSDNSYCGDPNATCAEPVAGEHSDCTGNAIYVGDGKCDAFNNNPSCDYDGGDCCDCTCINVDGFYGLCSEFNCLDPGASCVGSLAEVYPNCGYGDVDSIGDGYCNSENNNLECGYDAGDCCPCTCAASSGSYYGPSCSEFNCLDPGAPCLESLGTAYPNCSYGYMGSIGNGYCDSENNSPSCGYDGGDCCPCTCVGCDGSDSGSGAGDCLDPDAPCSFRAMYPDCPEEATYLAADGSCHTAGNSPSCGYDGGDCCPCTCGEGGGCFYTAFDCSDPVAGRSELHDCRELPDTIPCLAGTQREWLVENTMQALALAETINCSGGAFVVEWRGHIVVEKTIVVTDGTMLNVTGVGSTAIMDGNGTTQLLTVSNASLLMNNITMTNGTAFSGGAIAVGESNVTLNNTTFTGNYANGGRGGALFISKGSSVSFSGETRFSENFVSISFGTTRELHPSPYIYEAGFLGNGGALEVSGGSSVRWSGEMTFVANEARDCGGALMVSDDSRVSWRGRTTFSQNFGRHGGAIHAGLDSSVSWSGQTNFEANSVSMQGGALFCFRSSVSWSGDTSFTGNRANEHGGAVFVSEGSNVSWSANAFFVKNSGSFTGGAISTVGSSSIFWSGETRFSENEASYGGAISLNLGVHMGWNGTTTFLGNEASSYGGAIGSREFGLNTASDISELSVDGTTLFVDNLCDNSGGAMALLGFVAVSFSTRNLTFFRNSAGLAGGGMYVHNTNFAPVLRNVNFSQNVAELGGAIYLLGNGITMESMSPTMIIAGAFVENVARTSGGAIESTGGEDEIKFSIFRGNRAKIGGALRLTSTVILTDCVFEENVSFEDGGPAVWSLGYMKYAADNRFVNNLLHCNSGEYLNFSKSGDAYATVCDGCSGCSECSLESQPNPHCIEQLQHTNSTGGTTTIEEITVDEGFWRATSKSDEILACYNEDACLGGVTGTSDYCAEGYQGPYCSVCSRNYAPNMGFTCTKCSSNNLAWVIATLLGASALLFLVLIVSYLISGQRGGKGRGVVDRLKRNVALHSMKIIIVVWQILTQFTSIANVTYPSLYQDFLDGVNFLNFDLSWVVSVTCFFDINFYHRLLVSSITPIIALFLLGVTYAVAVYLNRQSTDGLRHIHHKHASMVLLLTFLVYSSVSSTIFQTFACEDLDDGKRYLRADYRIECDRPEHKRFQIYAGFMIALYPVGIPALYAYLLFRYRGILINPAERERSPLVESISNLWEPYRPGRFYYEVLECGRRISLAGTVVFIFPNSAAQVAVTIMIAVFFVFVSEVLAPYASVWDTWLSRMGHATIFTSMYVALLLKVDISRENAESQEVFAAVLVAAHVCMLLVIVAETLLMTWTLRTEDEEPRSMSFPVSQFRKSRAGFLQDVDVHVDREDTRASEGSSTEEQDKD